MLRRYANTKIDYDTILTIHDTAMSNNDLFLVEIFAEFFGRRAFMFAEKAIEIRQRIKPTGIAYLGYR